MARRFSERIASSQSAAGSSRPSTEGCFEDDAVTPSTVLTQIGLSNPSMETTLYNVLFPRNLSMKRHGKPAAFEHFVDTIVVVETVGNSHESLQVHKSLLRGASQAIAKAFHQRKTCVWDSTADFMCQVEVDIDDTTPDVVRISWNAEHFSVVGFFVGWLYTGSLTQGPKPFDGSGYTVPSLIGACRLWVFANKIKNSALANDAMNACYDAVSTNTIVLYSPEWSNWVYENTIPGALLRAFVAQVYGVRGDPSISFDHSNGGMRYPKELLIDVFRVFTKALLSPIDRLRQWTELELSDLYLPKFPEERGMESTGAETPQDHLHSLREMAKAKLPEVIDISDDGSSSEEAENSEED